MISGMFKEKLFEEKILLYLKVIAIGVALIFGLIFKNYTRHLFVTEASELSTDASKRDFCTMAMNQMIHKKLSKMLMEEDLHSQVIADNYKAMLFDQEDKVGSVFSGEESCKVLVQGKDGLRSFDLTLEAGSDFKYFYQIKKIHENELYRQDRPEGQEN